jgi:hypothetical protein
MANYDIAEHWNTLDATHQAQIINLASGELLKKWAFDPDCNQKGLCLAALAKSELRAGGGGPFHPRTEVSADARYIVKNLWIIFVALPFVLGILIVILKNL